MVPRRLIDALSLYYSGRCNILLSKMSLTALLRHGPDHVLEFDHTAPAVPTH